MAGATPASAGERQEIKSENASPSASSVERHHRVADVVLEVQPPLRGRLRRAEEPEAGLPSDPIAGVLREVGVEPDLHVHHVDVGRVRNDREPIDRRESSSEALSALEIRRHPREAFLELHGGRRGLRRERVGVAAAAALPDRRLRDEVGRAEQHRAGEGADALVERHVARREPATDGVVGSVVEGATLPEACAVQVERNAASFGLGDQRVELLSARQLAPGLADRELDE